MGMNSIRIYFVVLFIVIKTAKSDNTKLYKLYDVNMRVGGATESKRVESLLECSRLFKRNESSLSFSYNPVEKVCELSSSYPEDQAETGEGWNVYSPIVDGTWTGWGNWGSCTVDSTRSRSRSCGNPPSNGGIDCSGDSMETVACSDQGTYVGNYFISSVMSTWDQAKLTCEAFGGNLVIINDQAEQDFLTNEITVGGSMAHWIGMTCDSGTPCRWIDGTNVDGSVYMSWAVGEPSGGGALCVWMGFTGPFWDDATCSTTRFFVCEF